MKKIAKKILQSLGDLRDQEYKRSVPLFENANRILDIACGTGTFLRFFKDKAIGIDINPENIQYCAERGFKAECGSALSLPYEDESFDGVHCSHLMQVFSPNEAAQLMREIGRVLKPGGIVVIATLNWFPRFFRHPENMRPYPPDALWRYFATAEGASSPMFPGICNMEQSYIWLRRPPLVEFHFSVNKSLAGLGEIINMLQYRLFLRKYWSYNSYVIGLRKR